MTREVYRACTDFFILWVMGTETALETGIWFLEALGWNTLLMILLTISNLCLKYLFTGAFLKSPLSASLASSCLTYMYASVLFAWFYLTANESACLDSLPVCLVSLPVSTDILPFSLTACLPTLSSAFNLFSSTGLCLHPKQPNGLLEGPPEDFIYEFNTKQTI